MPDPRQLGKINFGNTNKIFDLTNRQRDLISSTLKAMEEDDRNNIENLTPEDSEDVPQFVLGVDGFNSNVRIGSVA